MSLGHQLAKMSCMFGVCVYLRDTSDLSAVCAYRVSDISRVFAEGKYKTPVPVETSFVKWVMYSGEVPIPRPGAVSLPKIPLCILFYFFKENPSRKLIPFCTLLSLSFLLILC